MVIKNPRGHSVVSAVAAVILTVVAVAFGGLGVGVLAIANAIDCHINVFYGCGPGPTSSGGGGGGSPSTRGGNGGGATSCSSLPNACGMTNLGTLSACSRGPGCSNGAACSATVPPNSACPPPQIQAGTGFYANPSTIGVNSQTTLYWNAANATDCDIAGDNGFTYSGSDSGSTPTGTLAQTATFTLTCRDGDGGPTASKSIRVIVDPHYKEL